MPSCLKCSNKFPCRITFNGKTHNLGHRKYCVDCVPVRTQSKTLNCKQCGEPFLAREIVNGKKRHLYSRDHCLTCIPFGTGLRTFTKQQGIEKLCPFCGKTYVYDRKLGHRAKSCNSCTTVARHIIKKKRAVAYKGGKCVNCNYNRFYGALEFHHLDPSKKDFAIGAIISREWKVIKAELDKCILVCSNCHREIHGGLLGSNYTGQGNDSLLIAS